MSWKTCKEPEPAGQYVAQLTYLPLRHYRAIPRFLGHSRRVEAQLRESDGLIGYSLKANFWKAEFWTLSVWASEEALESFVAGGYHREVMVRLQKDMGPTRFRRWKLMASALPPEWHVAFASEGERIAENR